MNDFEFLRLIGIGQFIPVESIFRRLDGRARLVICTIIFASAVFTSRRLGIFIAIGLIACGFLLGRVSLKLGLRSLLPLLPFILILAAIQVLYNPYPKLPPILLKVWIITITPGDLWAGAMMLLRFTAMFLGISLVSLTFSTAEMTHSLEGLLKPLIYLRIPVDDFIMIVQITLRFIPSLAQTAERVAKAQAARGGEWGTGRGSLLVRARQVFPMILPLFLISLRSGETLALAMDSRGYGAQFKRTSMIEMKMRPVDFIAILGAIGMAAVVLFV